MAGFTVSSLTDYTEKATEMLRAGVLFADDLSNYSIQQGIQYKEYLNFISADPHVQAGACGLAASGDTTLTESTIEVVTYAYRDQFCKNDLVKKALSIPGGTLDGDFGPLVENSLTQAEIAAIKKDVEVDLWLGTSGMIDGWFANLSAATGAISLDTYTATTVTSTNVDDVVDDFIDNINDAMWSRGVLTLHCSVAIYNMYKRNRLYANYYRDADATMGNFESWVFGYENQIKIKGEPGLAGSNYMILTWDKNLYIGTDELGEVSSAEWYFNPSTKYLEFSADFKLGTQIAFPAEAIHNMY
jgi:hypothetical protein